MEFRNAPKKRTSNFREDETKLLIKLWGSSTIQNKLYLTHRKAPVMRLIAMNMAKRGFHRTPDEIKTRIRNLKCLYHRIKKSVATGAGIGTVDPDWPHYRAMDTILSRKHALRQQLVYNQNLLSEVNSSSNNEMAIKKELEAELELDNEEEQIANEAPQTMEDSYTSNSNGSEDEFEEQHPAIPATVTPLIIEEDTVVKLNSKQVAKGGATITPVVSSREQQDHPNKTSSLCSSSSSTSTLSPSSSTSTSSSVKIKVAQNLFTSASAKHNESKRVNGNSIITTAPSVSSALKHLLNGGPSSVSTSTLSSSGHRTRIPAATSTTHSSHNKSVNPSSVPFPLLILNGLQQPGQGSTTTTATMQLPQAVPGVVPPHSLHGFGQYSEFAKILKEMLDIQKENLEIHRERLQIEREKMNFERTLGSQLLSMAPVLNSLLYQPNDDNDDQQHQHHNHHHIIHNQQQSSCITENDSSSFSSIVPNATSVITHNKLYEDDIDGDHQLIVDRGAVTDNITDLVIQQDDENDNKNFIGHPNYHLDQYETNTETFPTITTTTTTITPTINDDNTNPLKSLKSDNISKTVIDGIKKYMEKHSGDESEETGNHE